MQSVPPLYTVVLCKLFHTHVPVMYFYFFSVKLEQVNLEQLRSDADHIE